MTSFQRSAHDLLASSLWFPMLTAEQRTRVTAEIRQRDHARGEYVCRKGEIADSWIGVVEGFLRVDDPSREGKVVTYTCVAANGWIGEGSLLKMEPRRYEIAATRPSRTAHLPRATFSWLLESNVAFSRFLLDHLNERLSQFISMLAWERVLGLEARVARCMASLYHPFLYPTMSANLKLSQDEVGWLSGISRPHVNRALKRLQSEGLIHLDYASVTILDIEKLRNYE